MAKEPVVKIPVGSFRQDARRRIVKIVKGESMTKVSFQNEVDINQIVERAQKNGTLPARIQENPVYGEFTRSVEWANAHDIVVKAQEQFMGLDARTRAKFNNNPAEFLAFAENPNNLDQMIELGLAKRKQEAPKAEAPKAEPKVEPKAEPKKD